MRTKLLTIAALTAVFAVGSQIAVAQAAGAADAKETVRTVAVALGMLRTANRVDAVSTQEVWATGTMGAVGQAYKPGGPWPLFKITAYHAWFDYNLPGMRVELTRTNPDGQVQGGGGLPLAAPQHQGYAVNGKYSWNESEPGGGLVPGKGNANAAAAAANDRLLQVLAMPYMVVKAANKAGDKVQVSKENGATVLTIPLDAYGLAGVVERATLNSDNRIAKVETKGDNPILGDIMTETDYSGYKDLDDPLLQTDVMFPQRITIKQGGFPILDLTVSKVDANNPYLIIPVPDSVMTAYQQPAPAVKVDATKIGDGVWFLAGGTHNSLAIEFQNYVALFECPLGDERTLAVIDKIKETIPNKPIQYAIDTHHHFDHSGGLRACESAGLTIVTQAEAKPYFDKVLAQPHTVNPDRQAKMPGKKALTIEGVADERKFADSTQTLELYRLQGSDHTSEMLVGYLPKQKILIEADNWNPPAAGAPVPPPNKEMRVLNDNIQRLKLDVSQIAPIHGRMVTMDEFRKALGNGT
jgi:glyoxylase-like metal-dependent hydrolase (beta-lactamase superfamily II)